MEDNLIGRQPNWKTTSMEYHLNGRQPQWKMTFIEVDQNGRKIQWKTTSREDKLFLFTITHQNYLKYLTAIKSRGGLRFTTAKVLKLLCSGVDKIISII